MKIPYDIIIPTVCVCVCVGGGGGGGWGGGGGGGGLCGSVCVCKVDKAYKAIAIHVDTHSSQTKNL